MVYKVLVVEDDNDLLNFLKYLLLDNGYSVHTASDGAAALKLAKQLEPDLIVLDLGLPNITGETVCVEIKKRYPSLPVVILTGKDSPSDVAQGLNVGADDYVSKPFEAQVLLARIKARLRNGQDTNTVFKIDDLELNNKTLEVKRAGKKIDLTPKEFHLLAYLMSNKGRILTREMILTRIWLYAPEIETRVIYVYIGYLRKKVDSGFDKQLLHSVRGFGYVIKD